MRQLIIALIATIMIAGCSIYPHPSHTEIVSGEYGHYPRNYKELIFEKCTQLFSADAEVDIITEPIKSYTVDNLMLANDVVYGYGVIVKVNNSNRYFFIKNGKILHYSDTMLFNPVFTK